MKANKEFLEWVISNLEYPEDYYVSSESRIPKTCESINICVDIKRGWMVYICNDTRVDKTCPVEILC